MTATHSAPTKTPAACYLITGGTGAGKTTHAHRLADEIGGVVFSIDDWMGNLFWMDSPDPMSFDWTMSRIARCEAQIWASAEQVLARGLPVILDLGFTKSDHRLRFAKQAKAVGAAPHLHWVNIDAQTRWARVQSRNTQKDETFAMDVTREMFDFMAREWETPTDAERAQMTLREIN